MKTMQIKMASPCSARWEDMEGDERRRFCQQCSKHVYNFTRMSDREIIALVQEKEGKICARFYQRPDGTMLLNDCPRGAERVFSRLKIAVCSIAALFFVCAAAFAKKRAGVQDNVNNNDTAHPIREKIDDAAWKVKGWVGIQRPVPPPGKICVRPVKTNTPPKTHPEKK